MIAFYQNKKRELGFAYIGIDYTSGDALNGPKEDPFVSLQNHTDFDAIGTSSDSSL